MAKFDYSKARNTAIRLIGKFGKTLIKKTIVNSGTEWNPVQTPIETSIVGVSVNFAKNEIDGTLILSTDKKLLTYDEILMTDTITENGIEYNVVFVDTVNPADTKLFYKVQIRK